jgi:hypothetical protein
MHAVACMTTISHKLTPFMNDPEEENPQTGTIASEADNRLPVAFRRKVLGARLTERITVHCNDQLLTPSAEQAQLLDRLDNSLFINLFQFQTCQHLRCFFSSIDKLFQSPNSFFCNVL